jgi:hypothetical protein
MIAHPSTVPQAAAPTGTSALKRHNIGSHSVRLPALHQLHMTSDRDLAVN